MEKKDHIGLVSLAHYLTLMHIFPDTVLAHIFTFDFLEELDSVIEGMKAFLRYVLKPGRQFMVHSC